MPRSVFPTIRESSDRDRGAYDRLRARARSHVAWHALGLDMG